MKYDESLKYFREGKFDEPRGVSVCYGCLLAVIVFCFIVVPIFIFQTVPVLMQSMYPTIHGGNAGTGELRDCVGLSLLSGYGHGDIVVFERTENNATTRLIKRIVGVPGDTLFLVDEDGDGAADAVEIETDLEGERTRARLIEPYLNTEFGRYVANEGADKGNVGTNAVARELWSEEGLTLEEGEYFVAGDNRKESKDSFSFGPISGKTILGKAVCIFVQSGHSFLFWDIYNIKGTGPSVTLKQIA